MKWFLMIFHNTHRLMTCPIGIREASSSTRWEQVPKSTAKHYAKIESKLEVSIESLLWSSGTQKKRPKKDYRSQREWSTPEHTLLNQLSRVHMCSDTEAESTGSKWIFTRSSVHMLWILALWFYGTPNSGSRVSLTLWPALETLFLLSDCLVQSQ